MQKLWLFYRDIIFFCKKHQNSCLLFFLLTRSHNITESHFFEFFSNLLSFSFIFWKTEKAVRGGGGWRVIFFGNLPVAHGVCGALQVIFKFWKFCRRFKNVWKFSRRFKKIGRKLTRSAPYMYTRSALDGALWVSLKFKKNEFCSRPTYP
jgi:hypothetical protein